jgi:hypothetical protein
MFYNKQLQTSSLVSSIIPLQIIKSLILNIFDKGTLNFTLFSLVFILRII